jgi:hypothetical protein
MRSLVMIPLQVASFFGEALESTRRLAFHWKKLLVIIVGWQRIGKVIWVTCNIRKTTRLVYKSTK